MPGIIWKQYTLIKIMIYSSPSFTLVLQLSFTFSVGRMDTNFAAFKVFQPSRNRLLRWSRCATLFFYLNLYMKFTQFNYHIKFTLVHFWEVNKIFFNNSTVLAAIIIKVMQPIFSRSVYLKNDVLVHEMHHE